MNNKLAPKAVLFNGPPRCGKDSLSDGIVGCADFKGHYREKLSFGRFPKEGAHASFGLKVRFDHYEDSKDVPSEDFLGMTPRQAYITHSEQYMKPCYGKDVYARLMVSLIKRKLDKITIHHKPPMFMFSDIGFQEELDVLANDVFGAENTLLVQLHRIGADFKNDSRTYVSHPKVRSIALYNNFSLDQTLFNAIGFVKSSFSV